MRRLLSVAFFLAFACGAHAGDAFTGRVVSIADGDTLTVLDQDMRQHIIRLAEIDAPEKGQAWGNRSKQALAAVCFKKQAEIR